MMWLDNIIMNIFVYLPAVLFWIIVILCVWAHNREKKHKKRHEDDGK